MEWLWDVEATHHSFDHFPTGSPHGFSTSMLVSDKSWVNFLIDQTIWSLLLLPSCISIHFPSRCPLPFPTILEHQMLRWHAVLTTSSLSVLRWTDVVRSMVCSGLCQAKRLGDIGRLLSPVTHPTTIPNLWFIIVYIPLLKWRLSLILTRQWLKHRGFVF